MKRCKLEDRKRSFDGVNGYFKVAAILIFIFVLLFFYSNVKADSDFNLNDIASEFPGGISAVKDRIGSLITLLFNGFALLSIGAAGYGFVQIVEGEIKQDASAINHARSLIAFSFIGLVGIAVVPTLAGIMLATLGKIGNGTPLLNIFGGH
jgi:uncharacterized integral membrane protein